MAKDLGISESCLRNWLAQADDDENGANEDDERGEEGTRRAAPKNRQLEIENEILKRAAAFFARENVLPNNLPAGP